MEFRTEPVTLEAAATVLLDPCPVHAQENLDTQRDGRSQLTMLAQLLLAKVGGGVVVLLDDEPVAIFYHAPAAHGGRMVYFVARQMYFDAGVPALKGSRRGLDQIRAQHPTETFRASTAARHPQIARWLRLMGFVNAGVDNGLQSFILPPREVPQCAMT